MQFYTFVVRFSPEKLPSDAAFSFGRRGLKVTFCP
jgi:hypothetical protein